jgi:hypothetical protein
VQVDKRLTRHACALGVLDAFDAVQRLGFRRRFGLSNERSRELRELASTLIWSLAGDIF